jgi:phenylpropionate dioxygenase-like ring-hydroxylating dioxygenase large terminal subunit
MGNPAYATCDFDTEVELGALLKQVMAPAGKDDRHAETLPAAVYTDPAFYDLEVEAIFLPGWIAVAHVSQPTAEAPLFITLFGRSIRIEAAANGFAASFLEASGARPLRHEVVDGFIYVNLSGGATPLAPQVTGLSERLAKLRMDELVSAMELEYTVPFNWKILVETFMECYHHIAAHTSTFEPSFPARLSKIEVGHPAWTSGYARAHDTVPDDQITIGLPALTDDLTEHERRCFFLYLIYPNTLLAVWPDRMLWFRTQPDGPLSTRLQAIELVRPEALAPEYSEILSKEKEFLDFFSREDIAINEVQQVGAASRLARPGRLSHLETTVWHLANYVRSKIAAN